MHVIYGGTFDPVHHGHLRLAIEVAEALAVERVSLIPCHVPPHRGRTGASAGQRLALLRAAVEGEKRLVVDDRELRRGGASYTADTLRQLREELGPQVPLVMVLGTDAFATFDRWRDWQLIPGLAHLVVIRRPGADLVSGSVAQSMLAARRAHDVAGLRASPAGCILPLSPPLLEISATDIRARVASGRSPRYLLPEAVWQKVQEMGLYQTG
ncbi:MAG TPA: nicotinate-nucleotide adenylyltransferase [Marinobacter sp.]|nr:nicotinate-nucleotide adenylyltransferase [Marinobacter sp.]